jgi:hypothetical protein
LCKKKEEKKNLEKKNNIIISDRETATKVPIQVNVVLD